MQNQNDFNTTAFQVFKSNEIEIMKKFNTNILRGLVKSY